MLSGPREGRLGGLERYPDENGLRRVAELCRPDYSRKRPPPETPSGLDTDYGLFGLGGTIWSGLCVTYPLRTLWSGRVEILPVAYRGS